jgi:hypothetical protein
MTAFNNFTFFGYLLRPVTYKDLDLAKDWTARDPDHQQVNPHFWIDQGPGNDAYLLVDKERDGPLFFFKLVALERGRIELHIQFDPGVDKKARARRREALMEGLMWLERTMKLAGIKEIVFKTRNSGLLLFAEKRLKFIPDPVAVEGETLLRKQV